jgi:phage tail-like protein
MADDGSKQSKNVWPLPKFYFSVDFGGGMEMQFQEVSGLDVEAQPIEFRAGNDKAFSKIKMPGIRKFSDITMKRGVIKSDARLWDWFSAIKMNTVKRRTVVIKLMDETGAPTMTWTLKNAFPTKITGTDLKAEGNEVAIETIEIAHEGLTIANP